MKKLAFLFSILTFNAFAQMPDTVLVKVSDIFPIKNDDDVTVACQYSVTAYNRTDADVSNVTINFGWDDDIITQTIEQEKKESKKSTNIFSRGSSRTEQLNSSALNARVTLPPIPAKKQIVQKEQIKTNKCFLLLEKAKFTVNSCRFSSTGGNEENRESSRDEECQSAFLLVGTDNPNYYTDFSQENYDALAKKDEDLIKKGKEELTTIHGQLSSAIKALTDTLSAM